MENEDSELEKDDSELEKEDSELEKEDSELEKEDSDMENDDSKLKKKKDSNNEKEDTEVENEDTEVENEDTEVENEDSEVENEDSEEEKEDSNKKKKRDSSMKKKKDSPIKKSTDSPIKKSKDSPIKKSKDSPIKSSKDSPLKKKDSPLKKKDSPIKKSKDSPLKKKDSPLKKVSGDDDENEDESEEEKQVKEESPPSIKRNREVEEASEEEISSKKPVHVEEEAEEFERMLVDYEEREGLKEEECSRKVLEMDATSTNRSMEETSVPVPTAAVVARVVEAALQTGCQFNATIMGKTDEIVKLSDNLILEVRSFTESRNQDRSTSKKVHPKTSTKSSYDFAAGMMPLLGRAEKSFEPSVSDVKSLAPETIQMFVGIENALRSLQKVVQDLQSASVQTEVNMISQVKKTTELLERKSKSSLKTTTSSSSSKNGGRGSGGNGTGVSSKPTPQRPPVPSTSRIYTAAQLNKMRSWYKLFPRPYTNEVDAMHAILNMYPYTDAQQQPNGLSTRHVRAWFDKRRALERQHYVKKAENEAKGRGLHATVIQKVKLEAMQKSKDIQEEKMKRLRDTVDPSKSVLLEADRMHSGELQPILEEEVHDLDPTISSDEIALVTEIEIPTKKRKGKTVTKEKKKSKKSKKVAGTREKSLASELNLPTNLTKQVVAVNRRLTNLLARKFAASKEEMLNLLNVVNLWSLDAPGFDQTLDSLKRIIKQHRKDKELCGLATSIVKKVSKLEEDDNFSFSPAQLAKLQSYYLKFRDPTPHDLKRVHKRINALQKNGNDKKTISTQQLQLWFKTQRTLEISSTSTSDSDDDTSDSDDDVVS